MPRIPVSTKCRQQTADRIQNIDCRLQSGYKMQTENLKSFYVWYIITRHLTAYRASRNRFPAISVHDYLYYCGRFLAHFLMKIDLNIISSLQYSLLTMDASCLVWCLYRFYQRIKKSPETTTDTQGMRKLLILREKCSYFEIFIVVNRPYFVPYTIPYNVFKFSTVLLVTRDAFMN